MHTPFVNSRVRLADALLRDRRGIVGRNKLNWHRRDNQLALHLGENGAELALVAPDAIHPGMWRIRHPDGRLSDMVNRARAKDAVETRALGLLNRRHEEQETPLGAPPIAQTEKSELGTVNAAGAS